MADQVLLVVAEDSTGDMVGGALNFVGSHALYGRNWGAEAGREYKVSARGLRPRVPLLLVGPHGGRG